MLWLELFKAALAGGHSAADADFIALKGVEVVGMRRGIDAPVEKLLRAVDGLGLYVDYPDEVVPRLRAVFDAAAAVKAARES